MSRVFDGNAANHLIADLLIGSNVAEGAMGIWFKASSFVEDQLYLNTGNGSAGRRWMGSHTAAGYPWGYAAGSSVDLEGNSAWFSADTWQLMILRKDSSGNWRHDIDGNTTGPINDSTQFITSGADIRLGSSTSGTGPATVKLAHAFAFTRHLTDVEVASLMAGNDPSSLDPTGRLAYYKLTDSALTNEWNEDSGVGALTESGTVAVDAADNPTISVVATVAVDDAIRSPGQTVSFTYQGFDGDPTAGPVSVSVGSGISHSTDDASPFLTGLTWGTDTVDGNGKHSGSGSVTLGGLPSQGNSAKGLLFGTAQLNITDPGA